MNMFVDIPAIQLPNITNLRAVNFPTQVVMSIGEKLDSFADLEKGWDYGTGATIPNERIRAAKVWCRLLEVLGCPRLDASPGSDGEISVAGGFDDHHIEIIVESDDT